MALQDDAGSLQNDAGTGKQIDTDLTQPDSLYDLRPAQFITSRTGPGYTYFVHREEDGLIKIGFTEKPKQRMKVYGPNKTILVVVPHTIITERAAHEKFGHLWVEGESFKPDPELLAYIEEIKIEATDLIENDPKLRGLAELAELRKWRNELMARRELVGAESDEGVILSNLIEQLLERRFTLAPTWGDVHPSQRLDYKIKQQLDRLATFQ